MRISTGTLRVIMWLSAAVVMLCLACLTFTLSGRGFAVKYANRELFGAGGWLRYSWPNNDVPDRAYTFPPSVYLLEMPALKFGWLDGPPVHVNTLGLCVQLWVPVAISLAIGVPAFVTLRRRARAIKSGACPHCGYALVGIAPAAPCPECGRARA